MGRRKHPSDFNFVNAKPLPFQLFNFYFLKWRTRRGAYKEFITSAYTLNHLPPRIRKKEIRRKLEKQRSSQISRVTKKLLELGYLDEEEREFPSVFKKKRVTNKGKRIRGNLRPFFEFIKEKTPIEFSPEEIRALNELFEFPDVREFACRFENIIEGIRKAINLFSPQRKDLIGGYKWEFGDFMFWKKEEILKKIR